MSKTSSQALSYVNQEIIGHVNEIVRDGYIYGYIDTIDQIVDRIYEDFSGLFADETGTPSTGTFQILKSLRALRTDLVIVNSLSPIPMKDISENQP